VPSNSISILFPDLGNKGKRARIWKLYEVRLPSLATPLLFSLFTFLFLLRPSSSFIFKQHHLRTPISHHHISLVHIKILSVVSDNHLITTLLCNLIGCIISQDGSHLHPFLHAHFSQLPFIDRCRSRSLLWCSYVRPSHPTHILKPFFGQFFLCIAVRYIER